MLQAVALRMTGEKGGVKQGALATTNAFMQPFTCFSRQKRNQMVARVQCIAWPLGCGLYQRTTDRVRRLQDGASDGGRGSGGNGFLGKLRPRWTLEKR